MEPRRLSRRHLLTAAIPGVCWGVLASGETEAAPVDRVDLDTQRYEDLTAAEMVSMTVGIRLQEDNPHQAQRIMSLSLDLEHLIAVVNIDPAKIPQEQLDRITLFRTQLEALSGVRVLLHILGDFGRRPTVPAEEKPRDRRGKGAQLPPTGHPTFFGGSTVERRLMGLGRAPRSPE